MGVEPVPLSEEELRLLEQMERALVQEDPKFASTLRGSALRQSSRRRAILAGIAFLGGIALLMAGAVLRIPLLGIGGFLVMLVSATVALTALRASTPTARATDAHDAARGASHDDRSFMERLEERWRRRRDDGH